MVRHINKLILLAAISLMIIAISRPVTTHAATSPVVTILNPVRQGLDSPVRVALDAAGNFYVADQRNRGVVKFNPYGVPLQTVKTPGIPRGVAIAQDGKLLVSQGDFVAMYDLANGQEAGRLSGGTFRSANGMAVDDVTGYIYVVDSVANEIQTYTASGLFSSKFGMRGTLPGQFSLPTGIAFEKVSRQLVVADTLNNRVQFFNVNGAFVKTIGTATSVIGRATTPMQFASPQAVTFEYSKDPVPVLSRMYVVDTFQGNIQVIDPAGAGTALYIAGTSPLSNYIGSAGTANGQLLAPTDVVFDRANSRLMVVNGYGNIAMYGIDGGSNPFDNTPPTLGVDPVPATVLVPSVTISGTVEAGAMVAVTAANAVASPVTYTSSSTWKSDITGLVAGSNVITVTATDAAGNMAAAPTVNVTYILRATVIGVSSTFPRLTNAPNIELSGTVDEGATVTIINSSTSVSGTAAVSGTAWTYLTSLAEGTNSFSISAQKPLSLSGAASVVVTLDTVPPALTVSALSDGSYTSNQVQNITGNAADAGTVTVLVNNVQTDLIDGSFSVPVSLVTGPNTITVAATDLAGNVTVSSRKLYFDATKPVITVAAPMDNSFTNNAVLQISGNVDKVSAITVAGVPAVADGSNNWSAGIELVAGINTIEIAATDLYGNTSSIKRSVTLDTLKPTLAISSPVQDIALNQSSLTISGSVNDDNTTTLSYSVKDVVSMVPVEAGNFSFKVDFTTEGIYPVIITATDLAGNSTTATRSLIYDTTPPALSIDPVIATVFAPGITISGTVEAGASVVVTTDSAATAGTVVFASPTTWTSDITGLVAGNNTIAVTARDAAGNTTPAEPVITTYLMPAPAMGVASVPGLTNLGDYVLSGTVDDGATVTVINNSTSVSAAATVIGGAWTCRVSLAEGPNSISISAQKQLSLKASASVGIVLDSIPPVLAVSALSDGSYTSTQVQNVTGAASDTTAVSVLVNNIPVTLVNGSFSVPVTLVNGANVITVVAGDLAGNVTVNNRTLYFDDSKPVINIAAPMDNSFTNNEFVQLSGTVDKKALITVAGVAAVVDGSNNWSGMLQLSTGLNTIEVVATDIYGNTSTLKRSITLDTVKPTLEISSPVQDIATNSSAVTITGSVNDSYTSTVTYSINGLVKQAAVEAGLFAFKVDFTTEGIYPVTITAADVAGNTTTATRSLIYDVTLPLLTVDVFKGSVLSGTVEPGASVDVKSDGISIAKAPVEGNKWSVNLTGINHNKTKLTVVSTDAAGNVTVKYVKDK